MFDNPSLNAHERVIFHHDAATAPRAIVALHSATVGSIQQEIHKIPDQLTQRFERSRATQRPTSDVADEMARERLSPNAAPVVTPGVA